MFCPKNENTKYYVIPTNKWLKPLERFITTDLNTKGYLMLAESINKEKIIVKINKGYLPHVIKITNLINKYHLPNFVKTYCSFRCNEDFSSLDTFYTIGETGFCNGSENSDLVTLEIMKKYKKGSLEKYRNKLDYNIVVNIIKQVLLAQIMSFYRIQFLHCDLHLGNLLISSDTSQIEYSFVNDKLTVQPIMTICISDFDYTKLLNQDAFNDKEKFKSEYDVEHTLPMCLYKSFVECLQLLKDKNKIDKIKNKLNNDNFLNNKLNLSTKDITLAYYKKYGDDSHNVFINRHTMNGIQTANILYSTMIDSGEFTQLIPRVPQ